MPDLKDLRALIKDHQEKDSGLTVDAELCLQTWLVQELADLEARKIEIQRAYDGSMAAADTTEIDAEIKAKHAEIEGATVLLHFKALSEPRYRDILREFPISETSSPSEDALFFARLTEACYRGVKWGGTEFSATELTWQEIRENVTFGELDPIYGLVFGLNRRKIDRPLSSRPSKASRPI